MKIYVYALLFFWGCLAASEESVRLIRIINNSPEEVIFKAPEKEALSIKPAKEKRLLAVIPFHDAKKHLFDFVNGNPYKPDVVLEVTTSQGVFSIWVDHRGVIMARELERGLTRHDACPAVQVSLKEHTSAAFIGLILNIDNRGFLSFKKQLS